MSTSSDTATTIADLRPLPPMQRHQKVFQLVEGLKTSESFILVNDHDPKPLYYQLEAEYAGQFSWNYLESGPVVWRVEIARLKNAA